LNINDYLNSNTVKGVKPRFDNGGSEFGLMHRDLPQNNGMFDIDRMQAVATVNLELTKQDVAFIEYRTNWETGEITWKALFEIKHKDSAYVQQAMTARTGTSTWAQIMLANTLRARFIFVIANNGKQPFRFFEWSGNEKVFKHIGTLKYDDCNRKIRVNEFWREIALI